MEEGRGIGAGYIVLIVVGVLVIIGAIVGLWYMDKQAAPEREAYAALAECLSSRDVTFYSAFWCPNCAQQKALFKGAAKKLPHQECSLPDRSQNEFCTTAKITNYPTWEFNGNLRCTGVVVPEILAHLADCPLPLFGDKEHTIDRLYNDLVVKMNEDRLEKRGISAKDIKEYIAETRTNIDTHLVEQHQTTLDETEDIDIVLSAIAKVAYSCEPYEQEEEIKEEGAEGDAEGEESAEEVTEEADV